MIGKALKLALRLGVIAAVVQWVRHSNGPKSGIAQPASAVAPVGDASPFTGDLNELTCTELYAKLETLAAEWSGDALLAQQAGHRSRYGELCEALRARCNLNATISPKPGDPTTFSVSTTPA